MKVTIIKDNFKKGLTIIEKITGKNFSLPILNNILIKAEKNILTLSGTDLEIGINYWSLLKVEKEGQIAVPAKTLSNLINFSPDEKINLETKENILFISGEKYKAQINCLSADDYPIIPKIKNENNYLEINGQSLLKGILKVINFCNIGQTYPELSGVYFNFSDKQLDLVSTDSFRLAKQILYFENKIDKNYSFILPQKAVRELVNIISENGGDNNKVRIYFEVNQIFFEFYSEGFSFPQFRLSSRLIEGEYPNYQEIIPSNYKTQIIADKSEFLNLLKSASLFSGKTNKLKVEIDPKNKNISLFAQNSDTGEIKISLPSEVKGEKQEVSFNVKFLSDGLSNIEGKKVFFELNGEEGPAILRSDEDQEYVYILMPIKG
jgi:DNA polymerase-3 subunit beta